MALSNLTKVGTLGIGSNIEVVGVVTTGQFKSGTSNLHSTGVELTNLNVSGIATIGGNLSIGGTLTYEDVTNIDSIGIITARAGVNVSGTTDTDGLVVSGVSTFSDDVTVTGSNKKFISNSTSSGDYVRVYGGSGTGKWDIYGNGADLRFTDNDSAGVVRFDTDLSIADKIIHTGDTDTAIRFSGADQVKIETAGTERVHVDGVEVVFNDTGVNTDFRIEGDSNANLVKVDAGNDRVGVGIAAPQQVFHVYHASDNGLALFESGDANCRIDLKDNSGQASVEAIGDALRFGTSSSNTERLRIDSNGRVVIGHTQASTNYGKLLHIHNSASAGASVHLTDSSTGTSNSDGFELVMHNQAAYIINREPSNMIFMTNGTNERLRITSAGSIQITPEGSTSNPYMLIDTSGDSVRFSAQKASGNNEFRFLTQSSGTVTERLRITSGGRTQVNLPSTSGSSSAISTAQAIVGTKHIHTVYHNFNSTNSGLAINSVIPTNSTGTVDIMGGWANGNGIVFKRFVWCASGATAISQVFSTGASRYGVSVSISTPTMSISGDYVNFNFTFSDSQGSKMEKLKIHFEYHKQFYVI